MKKHTFLNIGFLIGILLISGWTAWASEARITVYGIGYPPVKAQNKAQALLMAKRAALLDAYRKALQDQGDSNTGSKDEEGFYRRLSGFIKGLIIVNEEYLNDGGVKIEATVPKKDVFLYSKGKLPKGLTPKTGPARVEDPKQVTIEEWYQIIEKMVNIESKDVIKGGK